MIKNYAYRMDHDTGFAPNTSRKVCSLCGCKTMSVEKWAVKKSWILGFGGAGTGKPDRLIYMMQVNEVLSYREFSQRHPAKSAYLDRVPSRESLRILISGRFFYFGDQAISLPPDMARIIPRGRSPKCVQEEDIVALLKHIDNLGFRDGVIGEPNNPKPISCPKCRPSCNRDEEKRPERATLAYVPRRAARKVRRRVGRCLN